MPHIKITQENLSLLIDYKSLKVEASLVHDVKIVIEEVVIA